MKKELTSKQYYWLTVWIGIITILINIGVSALNYFKIAKHPPIYEIERIAYYDAETQKLNELNKKLNSGKYTLLYFRDLNINAPNFGDEHIVMLGKIEK